MDETWLTYDELGERLGISAAAARAMSRRHNWPRRTPNEHGALARVLIPADLSTIKPRPPAGRGANGALRKRLEAAEQRAGEERGRAERAEKRVDEGGAGPR
jgi:hypothetical protein